jgi:hypothetical protein
MNSLLSYANHLSAATLRPLPGDWQSVHAGAPISEQAAQILHHSG